MPLSIGRYTKTESGLTLVDGCAATISPTKFTSISKMNTVVQPIPGDYHYAVPIGPEAKEYTIEFGWNMNNPPCTGQTFAQSLRRWTCNSLYGITPTGSMVNDIDEAYYLAKNISYLRERTGMSGGEMKWIVNMSVIKVRDSDITDSPEFDDPNTISTDSLTGTPELVLTRMGTAETISVQPHKIMTKHTGAVQAFALYDEEAITIMPPLGNTGPVIDIDFRVRTDADYATIKDWGKMQTPKLSSDVAVGYPEFDVHNAPTYYSVWVASNINIERGLALSTSVIERKVSMSLTRYWGYQNIELGV